MGATRGDNPGDQRGAADAAIRRALSWARAGRPGDAEEICRNILAERPDCFEALALLGVLAHGQGREQEADGLLARAGALRPAAADVLAAHALVLRALGRHEEALAALDAAINARPEYFEAHFNRGNTLLTLRRSAAALAAFDRALALNAEDAGAWVRRGIALQELGREREALESYANAVELAPDDTEALRGKAAALQSLNRHEEALPLHEAAFRRRRDATGALGAGNALQALGRYREALDAAEQALALQPEMPEALINRGNALRALGRHREALDSYARVIAYRPDDVGAHWNAGLTRLTLGDFERGWPEYEWRLRGLSDASGRALPEVPTWHGTEDLTGKTIVLYAEQGFGDAIQFVRYAPRVAARGARVRVACREPLERLFRTVPGVDDVCTAEAAQPADYQAFLMSLPGAFATGMEDIPAEVPYVAADPARVEHWRARLAESGARRNVGLVWRGNPEHPAARSRDCPAALLPELLAAGDCAFFSLQLDEGAADLGALAAAGRAPVDLAAELGDFHETGALIAALDLVISVDTAIAHLAGALGRPAWVLLSFAADWRWLVDRDDSPWYPSLHLLRQTAPGDWHGVLRRAAARLMNPPIAAPDR